MRKKKESAQTSFAQEPPRPANSPEMFVGIEFAKTPISPSTSSEDTESSISPFVNWFERHLNWTIPIGIVGIFIINLCVEFTTHSGAGVGIIIFYALLFALCGWVLRRKGRSLAWVLIIFVPFGWIVFLTLTNKNAPEYDEQAEKEKEEQERKVKEDIKQDIIEFKEKHPGRF